MTLDPSDAEYLLNRPEFLRFMYAAIQSAGLFGHQGAAHGPQERDFLEGRRSLGLELVMLVDQGQPGPLQSAEALVTLSNILNEAINPKGRTRGRRTADRTADRDDDDRYGELGDKFDADGDAER